MKIKIFSTALIMGLLWSNFAYVQDTTNVASEADCNTHLSVYTEFYNQKNYTEAMTSWRWCFLNCPKVSKNIYIQGPKIVEHFIGIQTDEAIKQAYVDTLLMVYDKRIEHYGQEGIVLGYKGMSMLKYRQKEIQACYDIFARSFELLGNKSQYFVLRYYMNTGVILFKNNILTKEQVVELYAKMSEAINFQIANDNGKNATRLAETSKQIEDLFINSGAADCEAIIGFYGPKYAEDTTNVELAKKIIDYLDKGKSDDCKLSDLYMNAAVTVYQVEKTSTSAHAIAQSYFKRSDSDNAKRFYEEAIELEQDSVKKADMYYELGLLNYSNIKNYPAARTAARNALNYNPQYGKAYILIGNVYAAGARGCGDDAFSKKSVNWLIVDQYIKAKNIDPSIAEDANKLINRYSGAFPTQEEGFWLNISEGQSVTIGCWVNESTTVRYIK